MRKDAKRRHAHQRKDEITMRGLFHKRRYFLSSEIHLMLSNKPKAIRPRAHCLKKSDLMRIYSA